MLTDARLLAQYIALAPFVFQSAVCLRDFGILKALLDASDSGLHFNELLEASQLSRYSLSVLLDAGESSGILSRQEDQFFLTQVGQLLESDAITRINMNFSQDVCYQGLFSLKDALITNTPAGLKVFGQWNTIYEGLSRLPEKAKKSWFEFDHYFSDDSFKRALPILFKENPSRILDVGGNTGKFAVAATQFSHSVKVTIVDHSSQIKLAQQFTAENKVQDRVEFYPADLLDPQTKLPTGFDIIWMSQFLCCFSEESIIQILKKARQSMSDKSSLFIMETFTDNQKYKAARFCLDMTSLYFTAMANGNSRMYPLKEFSRLIEAAGLRVVQRHPNVRLNHTILQCQPY